MIITLTVEQYRSYGGRRLDNFRKFVHVIRSTIDVTAVLRNNEFRGFKCIASASGCLVYAHVVFYPFQSSEFKVAFERAIGPKGLAHAYIVRT